MGVPTSEVGYTSAMPRREDHEAHKGHVVALGVEKKITFQNGNNLDLNKANIMHIKRQYL